MLQQPKLKRRKNKKERRLSHFFLPLWSWWLKVWLSHLIDLLCKHYFHFSFHRDCTCWGLDVDVYETEKKILYHTQKYKLEYLNKLYNFWCTSLHLPHISLLHHPKGLFSDRIWHDLIICISSLSFFLWLRSFLNESEISEGVRWRTWHITPHFPK